MTSLERLAAGEAAVLRLVARGAPLSEVLESLVRLLEAGTGAVASVLLVENGRLRHGAAPGLPAAYVGAVDGEPIGPVAGSCGTAAFRKQPVLVEDVRADPLWAPYRDLALGLGFRSCWSVPIFGAARAGEGEEGAVLGTFALYDETIGRPSPERLELLHYAAEIAAVAIVRHKKDTALLESEARFRRIVEGALDAHVLMRADGTVSSWSARAEAIFGWTADEALGRPLADLVIPLAKRKEHAAGIARYLATAETRVMGRRVELEALHKDGRTFPIELAVTPLQHGGELQFSGFVGDLRERKAAERALREQDATLAAVYQTTGDVLFHVAVEEGGVYRFTAANRAFYATTGLGPKDVVGRRVDEVIPPASRSAVLAQYDEAVRQKARRRWVEVTPYPSGEKHGEVSIVPIEDEHGRVVALAGAVHDLTDRVTLEAEMRHLQRVEILGRLTAGVAHDVNNVLAVVLLGADVLERAAGSEVARAELREVREAGLSGARLTQQFLALSRTAPATLELVDLRGRIESLSGLLRRLVREDVEITTELDPEAGPVLSSPSQLDQVVINLVVNARDAITGRGHIAIRSRALVLDAEAAAARRLSAGRWAELTVADDGAGMSDDVKKRVFEPFFTTKEAGRGTGLGLSIVERVVSQAGGRVELGSEPGRGTTVTIVLPIAAGGEGRRVRPRVLPSDHGEMLPARILLVEDDPPLRRTLARVLEQLGHRVRAAGMAEEARVIVEEGGFHPELLVTDTVMPGESGLELAEELRKRFGGLGVLFVSAYAPTRELEARAADPRAAHLDKPFSIEALTEQVEELLSRVRG